MGKYQIYSLRCANRKSPEGLDIRPWFSWKLRSVEQNTFQTAYQIRVTDGTELFWDSGKIESEELKEIVYEGKPFKRGNWYQWSVISWDNHGNVAESGTEYFMTGMLKQDEWKAGWVEADVEKKPLQDAADFGMIISGNLSADEQPEKKLDAPVYFRKEFSTKKNVKRAVAYVTAHGLYEMQIDGVRVSNMLVPEYTAYHQHLEYQTYDVTHILQEEEKTAEKSHAVGCILADGWYSGKIGLMGIGHQYGRQNAILFQIEIEYEDGVIEWICSDKDLKWNFGAYQYADLFVGEYIDMSKEPKEFSKPGFDDSHWKSVVVKEYGYENLRGQSVDPVCVIKTIQPTLIRTPKGELVLDAGENICGYTSFSMQTTPGTEIGLEHSEVLDKDGNFLQNILGQNKNQKDRILISDTWTKYEPRFTFHGFRYVKVTGTDNVNPEAFVINVIGSRLDKSGSFKCSDERLNKLQENIFRSQQGNMVCIPTDCPQRERAGWTGDMQVYASTAVFNMDMRAFLNRWLYDLRMAQKEDGQIPNVVPEIDSNKYVNGDPNAEHISSAGWADACVLIPYVMYRAYGDEKILRENYSTMKRWLHYVEMQAGKNLKQWGKLFHFGDWLIPSIMAAADDPILSAIQTKEEVAMAYWAYTVGIMSEIAVILNKKEDADYYMKLNQKIASVFSKEYVDENGKMRQDLQGLYVIALAAKVLDRKQEAGAVLKLKELIHESGDCLDTGFLSVPFLLDILFEYGESDLAYTVLFQEKAPSWLYALKHGATTIWERWAAILPDGTRTNSSYNHFAFGCVGDFIYRRIGGIQIEEVGYRKVRIAPDFNCGLDWAETLYDSVYGKISVRWEKKEEKEIELDIILPPNVSGVIMQNGKNLEVGNGRFQILMKI